MNFLKVIRANFKIYYIGYVFIMIYNFFIDHYPIGKTKLVFQK